MRSYIIADNQELTRFALESLLQKDEEITVYRAFEKHLPQTGYKHSARSGEIRASCGAYRSFRILYLI